MKLFDRKVYSKSILLTESSVDTVDILKLKVWKPLEDDDNRKKFDFANYQGIIPVN